MSRYVEVVTNGFDEGLNGISSSIYGGLPSNVGLRIPSFDGVDFSVNSRYLFLLGTRVITGPTRLVNIGQLLSIGASSPQAGLDAAPELPLEFDVKSPEFKFPDGNVSWHLVIEPDLPASFQSAATDVQSFAFVNSRSPALLYQTFAAAPLNPQGGPVNYPVSLTAYTPPLITGQWTPVAEGLGTFNDLRFPWQSPAGLETVDIPLDPSGGPMRVSFYASVLQTAGTLSVFPVIDSPMATGFLIMPEWQFVYSLLQMKAPPSAVQYWRIGGRMVFEDGPTGRTFSGGCCNTPPGAVGLPDPETTPVTCQ